LLVVLDTLTPAERVAFVPARCLRAPLRPDRPDRRPQHTGDPPTRKPRPGARATAGRDPASRPLRQAALVDAFLAAARSGDFDALLTVLDPDVVLRADEHAVKLGAAEETRGAERVAAFSRFARGARRALLDGAAAAVWMPGGRLRVVWDFTTSGHWITAIDLIADPERLRHINLAIPEDR
jgi:hypothetical protein